MYKVATKKFDLNFLILTDFWAKVTKVSRVRDDKIVQNAVYQMDQQQAM